jgi:hypothetical protein
MATQIYLGLPPPNVVKWIKDNYKPDMTKVPLTFTAEEPNAKLTLNKNEYIKYDCIVVTSTDGITWAQYEYGTEITLVNVGDKVYFRAADEVDN